MYNDDDDDYPAACGACGLREWEGVHCCDLADDDDSELVHVPVADALDAFAQIMRAVTRLSADRDAVLKRVAHLETEIGRSDRAIAEFRSVAPDLVSVVRRRHAHMLDDLYWLRRQIASYDQVLAALAEDQRLAERAFRDRIRVRPVR